MTVPVIVDASLALKWVLPLEDYTPEAMALLAEWTIQRLQPLAPSWFACEVANGLYQKVRAGILPLQEALAAVPDVLAPMTLRDVEPATAIRALELAHELGQKASYDVQYVAFAEREGCELWTADRRFWLDANPRYSFVRWIGERAGMT